jgi:hypothetical protein
MWRERLDSNPVSGRGARMDDAKSLSMIKRSCTSFERIKEPLCILIMKTIGPSLLVGVDGRLLIGGGKRSGI